MYLFGCSVEGMRNVDHHTYSPSLTELNSFSLCCQKSRPRVRFPLAAHSNGQVFFVFFLSFSHRFGRYAPFVLRYFPPPHSAELVPSQILLRMYDTGFQTKMAAMAADSANIPVQRYMGKIVFFQLAFVRT